MKKLIVLIFAAVLLLSGSYLCVAGPPTAPGLWQRIANTGATILKNISGTTIFSISSTGKIGGLNATNATIGSLSGVLKATSGIVSGSATQDDVGNGTEFKQTHNDFTDTYKAFLGMNATAMRDALSLGAGDSPTFTGMTLTGQTTGIAKYVSGVLSAATSGTDYIAGGVGTSGYLPKFSASGVLASSPIYTDGTNVGIGTTGPNAKLHIVGSGTSSAITQYTTSGAGNREFQERISGEGANYDTLQWLGNTASGGTTFSTLMSLTADGNLGVGYTSLVGGTGKLIINGNVGIGTTLVGGSNPAMTGRLNVFGGSFGVLDAATLGSTSLTNGALTSGTSWSATNDCALTANAATWTYSAGTASTLSQAAVDLAIAGVPNRWYKLTYTVSGISGTPTASVTTAFASTTTALTITAGTHTTYVKAASAPGAFTITSTLTTGQAFTIDTLSLTEVQGGSIASGAEIKLGPRIIPVGTTGAQTMNRAAGRVNAAAASTSLVVTNSLCTVNSNVQAVAATSDATGYVTSVVPAAGSFTIHYVAPTAEMAINWVLFN